MFITDLVKKANEQMPENPRAELEGVMQRIYEESPWKWPYGLSINAHDEIYMIREASTKAPAGFTGWQERPDGMEKVGFYTIGVLPEYRGNGMAKEALTKLISKKASTVDRVQALIVHGNTESENLARAIGVPYTSMEKRALQKAAPTVAKVAKKMGVGGYLARLLGGSANSVMWDQALHADEPFSNTFDFKNYDRLRGTMFFLNALLGAGGVHQISKGTPGAFSAGASAIALSPIKDLAVQSLLLPQTARKSMEIMNAKNLRPDAEGMSNTQKLGLGALGALGLGATAYGINRLANSVADQTANSQKARVKVTLPTKDPGDSETTIDAPVSDFGFSARVYRDLGRDTKRRLRGELDERKRRKKTLDSPDNLRLKTAAQQPAPPQVRTPWAMNYSQQQMPEAPPQPELVKQIEEAHAKIDDLSLKLEKKEIQDGAKASATPAPEPAAPAASTFYSPANLNARINSALKLVGASRVKEAATAPIESQGPPKPPEPPLAQKYPTSINDLQRAYELGNRTFKGKPGIQTPFVPYSVPFGETAHRIGTIARRAYFGTPGPSARAQFMENDPPFQSWQQQIASVAPYVLSRLAQQ